MRIHIGRAVDFVGACLFVTMFGFIVAQTFMRYVMRDPIPWSQEIATIAYIWLFFWSITFCTPMSEQVKFDFFSALLPEWFQHLTAAFLNVVYAILFIISFPKIWGYFLFLDSQATPSLNMPFQLAFGAYFLFFFIIPAKFLFVAYRSFAKFKQRKLHDVH